MTNEKAIAELEQKIDALKARVPKHSVPPALILELEDLEDELEALRAAAGELPAVNPQAIESEGQGAPSVSSPTTPEGSGRS
jgi:hypothetical protein